MMAISQRQGRIVTPRLVKLDLSYLDAVCRIEELSYGAPWSRALLARELQKTDSLMLGIAVGRRLVAQSFNTLVLDELHILNLSVHPDYRGLGLGKRLLASTLIAALERGAAYATLEVRGQNTRARNLYRSLGFRFVGLRKGYYQDNGEDAYLLERRIFSKDCKTLSALSGFAEGFRGLTDV